MNAADRSVIVTRHALDRAVERFGNGASNGSIVDDVLAAVRAGRVSCRVPRLIAGHGPRRKAKFGARFVWTEDEHRLYVIHPCRRDEAWKVLTAISPLAFPREAPCPMTQAA